MCCSTDHSAEEAGPCADLSSDNGRVDGERPRNFQAAVGEAAAIPVARLRSAVRKTTYGGFIFGTAPHAPLSGVRFRSEDGVGSDTDAAAAAAVGALLHDRRAGADVGLEETRPSARRMISLLTSADSKASLIQQRQQRISACKPSPWHLAQLYFFIPPSTLRARRVTSCSISLASFFLLFFFFFFPRAGRPGCSRATIAALIHRPTRLREGGREGWSCSRRRACRCRLTITS